MIPPELNRLLENFTDDQFDILAAIAQRMAALYAEGFTGSAQITFNMNRGGFEDTDFRATEVLRPKRRRA